MKKVILGLGAILVISAASAATVTGYYVNKAGAIGFESLYSDKKEFTFEVMDFSDKKIFQITKNSKTVTVNGYAGSHHFYTQYNLELDTTDANAFGKYLSTHTTSYIDVASDLSMKFCTRIGFLDGEVVVNNQNQCFDVVSVSNKDHTVQL
ncbi:hypothetical protein NL53_05980 [Vibrio variabilis]|uniref:Uncharacterized protein n=1 Tax=Vibrio variabilis TaxID=990271 RepID=A0ABR4YD18_9VIBR|nr:hypothetical protein [Vibrio variabilis]KHA61191.1 hypothetical protein NL53_05980 [Vibrio variabilis]